MSAPGDLRKTKTSRSDWRTPKHVVDFAIDYASYGREKTFHIDLAASAENSVCSAFYSGPCSGVAGCGCGLCAEVPDFDPDSWDRLYIWCNPPYGGGIQKWVDRCIDLGSNLSKRTVVLLVPNATDTKWWHKAAENASETILVKGRIGFIDNDGNVAKENTTGSTLFVFRGYRQQPHDNGILRMLLMEIPKG